MKKLQSQLIFMHGPIFVGSAIIHDNLQGSPRPKNKRKHKEIVGLNALAINILTL